MKPKTQFSSLMKLFLVALLICGAGRAFAGDCTPAPSGMVAWWPGDGTAFDVVGTNNGALRSGTTFAPGEVGDAFSFNGRDGGVSIAESPTVDLSRMKQWTVEAWINPANFTNSAWPTLYSEGYWDVSLGLNNGTGKLETWVNSSDQILSTTALPLNQWSHVAMVYDGTNISFYLNGQPAGGASAPAIDPDSGGSAIGDVAPSDPDARFAGRIDEVTLYNRALGADEIAAIYAAGAAGKCFTNDPAPVFVVQPVNQNVEIGANATLTGMAMGVPRPEYQWLFKAIPLPGATNATLTLVTPTPGQAGEYALVASNLYGSVTSAVATVTVESCVAHPSGLVAWWPGDGFAYDVTGTNNGTLEGDAAYANGEVGQAFNLNGGGFVQLPQNMFSFPASGTNNLPVSFELWFSTTSGGVILGQQITSPFQNPASYVPALYVGTDQRLHVEMFWFGSVNPITPTNIVADGNFHHLVVTYDGTNELVYLDGRLSGSQTASQVGFSSTYYYQLGTGYTVSWPNGNGGWYSFDGQIDEVALFNRALTSNEIAAMYAAGTIGMCYTNDPSPVFVHEPVSQSVYVSRSATLAGAAMGTPRPDYQWLFNGSPLLSATNATLTFDNVGTNLSGDYALMASNQFGWAVSSNATLTVQGTILDRSSLSNTTLTLSGSPYFVTSSLDLENVTIEPGVHVETTGNFEITVFGGLNAVGTESQEIVFTTTNASTKWQGIHFSGSTSDSVLAYCIIENSINSGIRIDNAGPTIQHCEIRGNQAIQGAGIKITGSLPVAIEDSKIYANTYSGHNPRGGGIYTTAPLTLIGCEVQSNAISDIQGDCFNGVNATTYGGGIYSTTDLTLEGDEVEGNAATSTGGAEDSRGGGVYTLGRLFAGNCIFANNSAGAGGCNIGGGATGYGGGIYCSSTLGLTNCIIANNGTRYNGYGGGIYAANGAIVNCTIADNNSPGGVYFGGSIINSILWGNSSYQFSGGASVTYSCVQGITPSNGNISDDPLLPAYDPAAPENLKIPCGSPCVDAGNPAPQYDDASNALCTPCGTVRNDMGADGGPGGCALPQIQWPLELVASPAAGGNLSGTGQYPDGYEATITAQPNPGYRFAYWIGDGITDTNAATTTILMTQARSATAQFVKVWNLAVSASPEDAGIVTGSGTYDDGTLAQISAQANSNSLFLGWVGAGITDTNAATTTVLMDQNRQVTARFTAPDLQVVSVSAPPQAWTGRAFDVSWVDTNAGSSVAVGPWVDRVYLSRTNQLDTNSDQLLGQFLFPGRLAPGQSAGLVHTVTINRAGVTNGNYYVSVLVDATNSVHEGLGETNNVGLSSSNINVQVTPLPDLVTTLVDAPTNGVGGQQVTVSWIVCNQGGGDTDIPLWYDSLYLSSTTNIWDAVAYCGDFPNPYYLAAGDCYAQAATVTLPIGVGGPHYFIVKADSGDQLVEDDKANNIGTTALPINIQLIQPGFLHVVSVQVAPAPPTVTWSGQPITCTYIVQNTGQSPITGVWDDRIVLSSVSNYVNGLTTQFAYENDIGVAGPLAPGASYTNSAQFILPQSVAGTNISGTWYVVPVVDIHFAAGGNGFGTGNIGRDELAAPIDVSTPPPSDLEVTSVSAPTNAVAGQAINVGWTVVNNGNNQTSASYWYDAVYLSSTPSFDPNQSRLVGTFGHWGVLDLTSNYSQQVSITVPSDILGTNTLGTNYLFVVADAGNAVVEYSKTNNILMAPNPILIHRIPPADLAVTSLSAPFTVVGGSSATISWTVANQGAGPTSVGSWVDSVYLSPSPTFNPGTAQWLGNAPHDGALNPGDSYTETQNFGIPYCPVGSYYVLVVADSGHAVNENSALTNNTRASNQPMRIWPGNPPHLEVFAVSSATNVLAGNPLTVSWTVANLGSSTANAPWIDAVYLSQTPQFDSSTAYLLRLYTNYVNLPSGGSYNQTQSAVVPRCFAGTYYVSVVTDVSNVVNGIACNTNNWMTSSTAVQVTPSGYASLQVANISLPATATSGVPWNVQWTITNAGPAAATGTWSDAVYASFSPMLDSSAQLLGQFNYSQGLASHATYTQSQPVTFPPCSSGQYYIYVVADVDNHVNSTACVVNNEARSATPLTVNIGPWPDLVVSHVSIPATAYAGQPMEVSWAVTNAGEATATSPWLDAIYLGTGSVFDSANSLLLGTYPHTTSLPVGAGYTQTAEFTLPNETHGDFYAYVVTDSSNAVEECHGETNNVTTSAAPVTVPVTLYSDLQVTSVQTPASAYAGQAVKVTWIVTNEGTDATPGGTTWNDAVYLSEDEVLDPSDVRLANSPSPTGLGVGQSYTNSATIQIPAGASGPYYVLVLADSGGRLFEHLGYNDSLGWNPDATLVNLPPRADLAASTVAVSPASGAPGDPITIDWTIHNASANNIPSEWTDALYLSTNKSWSINAIQVTRRDHSGLAASASYSDSWTGPLPALTPGVYYALLRTDVRNTVRETNFVNNIAVSSNNIAVDVPVLVLGQPATNQLKTGASQYYKLQVPAGETVRITLTGSSQQSANQLFVRYGAIPDLGNYDFLYNNPLSPNQQIEIPTTRAGWYYILVRGENEPAGPLAYTLEADLVPFAITGLSQNHIGDNGQVTITLTGAKFQPGATVELVSGTNAYFSETNFFDNATSFRARFMFTNAEHGIYDVVLTNPNNQSTRDKQSLTVEKAMPLTVQVIPGLVNNHPRVGLPFEWSGSILNSGNVDIQYLTVGIGLSQSFPIALNPPLGAVLADTNSLDNSDGVCFFLSRDIAPGGSLDFSFTVLGIGSQAFLYNIIPIMQSTSDYLQQVVDQAEATRSYVLATPGILTVIVTNSTGIVTTNIGTLPPDAASVLSDSNLWANLIVSNLVEAGLLDVAELTSFSTPSFASSAQDGTSQVLANNQSTCDQCATDHYNCTQDAKVKFALCFSDKWWDFFKCEGELFYNLSECDINYFNCKENNCGPGENPCMAGNGVCGFSPNDPNEMQGPSGYSTSGFVGSQVPWQYTVYFENTSNATAFARQIVITNTLDPGLDIRSFRVSEIAFGDVTIKVPPNRSFYQTRVAAPSQNPTNVVVDVTAGVDVQHNTVFFTMNAIDLNTGQLVQGANEGVLPPNSPDPIGVGHVTYTIEPAAGVPTGTVITNEASIVFDNNDPIITNPTTNTVDAVPPTSTVLNFLPTSLTTNFPVSWFGNDDPNGSGVADYDIYVSDNGGPWQPWQMATAATSATFDGQPGHSYYFYSVAHDNSGNIEATPSNYQAMTYVSDNTPPTLQPIPNQKINVGQSLVLTNVAFDPDSSQTITYSLPEAPFGASINPTNGIFSWTPECAQGSSTNLITILATDNGNPPLSNSMSFLVTVPECVQVSVGSTVVQVGQTSSVPVNLLSTVALTNLSFTLTYPTNRFENWTATVSNAAIGSFVAQTLDSTDTFFTLGTVNGKVLQGPSLVGSAAFKALSNSSAFVPLTIQNIQGTKSDGTPVGKAFGIGGRVVVVDGEPLLEAFQNTNRNVTLILYATPGSTNQILATSNLISSPWWTNQPQTVQSNLVEFLEVGSPTNQMQFFRAKQP